MNLRFLVICLLFLASGARRNMRMDYSHQSARQRNYKLATGLDESAEAREAWARGNFLKRTFRPRGFQTIFSREKARQLLNYDRPGSVAQPFRSSPYRAKVALQAIGGPEALFVINGFYMDMRDKFTAADAKVHYFVAEWPADTISWRDFRRQVLGATDPSAAEDGSIRKTILEQYKELGLASAPNMGDNGVHASASPFEALCERMNWLGVAPEDDTFGEAMLAAGISKETIASWCKDPQVATDGDGTTSVFDALEDLTSADCLEKAVNLAGATGPMTPLATNSAFVFVKPHAVTDKTIEFVRSALEEEGVTITKEGEFDGPTMENLIDNHYYAIANKATLTAPKNLNPPEAKLEEFREMVGLNWSYAIAEGKVTNAIDACNALGINGSQLETLWREADRAGRCMKFGGGFRGCLVDPAE